MRFDTEEKEELQQFTFPMADFIYFVALNLSMSS